MLSYSTVYFCVLDLITSKPVKYLKEWIYTHLLHTSATSNSLHFHFLFSVYNENEILKVPTSWGPCSCHYRAMPQRCNGTLYILLFDLHFKNVLINSGISFILALFWVAFTRIHWGQWSFWKDHLPRFYFAFCFRWELFVTYTKIPMLIIGMGQQKIVKANKKCQNIYDMA